MPDVRVKNRLIFGRFLRGRYDSKEKSTE